MTLLESSIGPLPPTATVAACDLVAGVITRAAAMLFVLDGDRTADVSTVRRGLEKDP